MTQSWRRKPLTSHEIAVNLIASTTNQTGLTVPCELDRRDTLNGVKVSGAETMTRDIGGNTFDPEWNCTISPRRPV